MIFCFVGSRVNSGVHKVFAKVDQKVDQKVVQKYFFDQKTNNLDFFACFTKMNILLVFSRFEPLLSLIAIAACRIVVFKVFVAFVADTIAKHIILETGTTGAMARTMAPRHGAHHGSTHGASNKSRSKITCFAMVTATKVPKH